jgi:hypothetical protein
MLRLNASLRVTSADAEIAMISLAAGDDPALTLRFEWRDC